MFILFYFITAANIKVAVKYPFHDPKVTINFNNGTTSSYTNNVNDLPSAYMQSGQFFVVWGIFSIFYAIIAIVVYMLTTANAQIEWVVNYLVLTVSDIMHR